MSAESQAATAPKVFAQSLSLSNVQKKVQALTTSFQDVLYYLSEGDQKQAVKASGVPELQFPQWFTGICCRRLGVRQDMNYKDKEQAALLMYRIFDKPGWRPAEEDEEFLILALNPDMPLPAAQPALPIEIPSVAALAERMEEASEINWRFIDMIARGESRENMLHELRKKDAGADVTSVDYRIGELLRFLQLPRDPDQGEAAFALIAEAHGLFEQAHTPKEPEAPQYPAAKPEAEQMLAPPEPEPEPEVQAAAASEDVPVEEPAPEPPESEPDIGVAAEPEPESTQLQPLVERIAASVASGGLSIRQLEQMKLLAEGHSFAQTAKHFNILESSLNNAIRNICKEVGFPRSNEGFKADAQTLIDAWKLYLGQAVPEELPTEPTATGRPCSDAPGIRKFIASTSETFSEDQAAALAEGFQVEEWQHFALEGPPVQVVTVLSMFKPLS